MKKILFFFVLLFAVIGKAQNDEAFVDALVSQKMAAFEMQQNPAYFYRKDYCVGNIKMFTLPDGKLCTSKSTYYAVYVFWKTGENLWEMQKFDNCGSFMPISLGSNKTLEKALKQKQALMDGAVKPYKSETVEENAFGNMKVQSCHKAYKFVLDGKAFEKSFLEYDLTNDSKYKNLNAEYNNSLELIKLDSEISELVKKYEESGKFFRE